MGSAGCSNLALGISPATCETAIAFDAVLEVVPVVMDRVGARQMRGHSDNGNIVVHGKIAVVLTLVHF